MVTKCRDDELQGPNVPKLPHQEIRIHLLTLHSPRKNNDVFALLYFAKDQDMAGGEKKIILEVWFGLFIFFMTRPSSGYLRREEHFSSSPLC